MKGQISLVKLFSFIAVMFTPWIFGELISADSSTLAQVLMMRLESDLAQVLLAACRGELGKVSLTWSAELATVVVMASEGYPGAYKDGTVIKNLDEAEQVSPAVKIFHAGTAFDTDGNFVAAGGRVLGVTAKGKDIEEARAKAYDALDVVDWPEGFYRHDIGWRALKHRHMFAH